MENQLESEMDAARLFRDKGLSLGHITPTMEKETETTMKNDVETVIK